MEDLCIDKNPNWNVGIRQQGWSQLKQNSHQLDRNNIKNGERKAPMPNESNGISQHRDTTWEAPSPPKAPSLFQ
jgi:hypothetical protein